MSVLRCIAVLGAALAASACSAQVALDPGVAVAGAIVAANEVDSYAITAQAGDVIVIRCARTDGDLKPLLQLVNVFGHPWVAVTANMVHFEEAVPVSGVYTIRVSDGFTGSGTGAYSICVQIANRPGHAAALVMGKTATSPSIPAAGFAAYTLSAAAGDTIFLRGVPVSGALTPQLRLYDPRGNRIHTTSSGIFAEALRTLPASGNYTLLVGDGSTGANTGAVALYSQRTNRPGGAVPVTVGQMMSDVIDGAAEMRTYTIPALAGETIAVWLSLVTGNLDATVRLFDPNGVAIAYSLVGSGYDLTQAVACAGTYTLIVADYATGSATGQYNLFVQKPAHPERATPLTQGMSANGALEAPAAMKTFTVTIPQSGVTTLFLTLNRTSGSFWPHMHFYDPYGSEMSRWYTQQDSIYIDPVVQPGKTYVAIVGDGQNGSGTGDFTITWTLGVPDTIRALQLAAGFAKADNYDVARLDLVHSGSAGAIDLQDAVAVARRAWGL